MHSFESLKPKLAAIDGKDYAAYQSLTGAWQFSAFELLIDKIPKDPYAPPHSGVYRVRVALDKAKLDGNLFSDRIRQIALRDYLARSFFRQCKKIGKGRRGTGASGLITIARPGQEILERSSVVIGEGYIEARFFIGLPASGRSIKAKMAESMLADELPKIVEKSLFAENLDLQELDRHIETAIDSEFIRDSLDSKGLIAFVADGAILPRASGVDPKPLDTPSVVKFVAPKSLRTTFEAPNAGVITGMGIPKGVSLIVGGGFHGKSTLLGAIELGVYNHIPGDGRQYCVSVAETAKIRASNGRSVVDTDISAFINDIPSRGSTASFSTANASGSTSQAAFIAESVEVGAKTLVMDEDTCATNFMFRDKRMQELVATEDEPITTFVDRVRLLYEKFGISTILVMGGSGDYFDVADCVIQMKNFNPSDVTKEAREVAKKISTGRAEEGGPLFVKPKARAPLGRWIDPKNEYGHFRISAPEQSKLIFGKIKVDLSDVEQIVDSAQLNAIGRAILHAKKYMDGETEFENIIGKTVEDIGVKGLDLLDSNLTGDLAQFRGLELAATINRIRSLEIKRNS